MEFINSLSFAQREDEKDILKNYRESFYFPLINNQPALYFAGNSLGLQPKVTQDYVLNELEDWATYGAEGQMHARNPWFDYHEFFTEKLARLVGAKNEEVVCMNQLTVNIHLLLVSFYKPTTQRYKIIIEANAFSSDRYAIESQIKFHGLDPKETLIEIAPKQGKHLIDEDAILSAIETHKNEIALIFLDGVNYRTGQLFNLQKITEAAHKAGALAGFDLAHAIGNIKLTLNEWNVDFAAWCSYKYLNSGPGGIAGVYINQKYVADNSINRFAGWWGHNKHDRFKMRNTFNPIPTAEGWQLSGAPILSMSAHLAALEMFDEVGMDRLIEKSKKLTGYLEYVLNDINKNYNQSTIELQIITPKNREERGCQLSVLIENNSKEFFDELLKQGVMVSRIEPNIMRLAPTPLYNSFEDVFKLGEILKDLLQ